MLREQTFEKLYSLKLHGTAQALQEQLNNPDAASLGFEERFAMLIDAQWQWRENRAMTVRLSQAKLKMPASMEDVNYRHPRQLDRAMFRSLASCDWVRQAVPPMPWSDGPGRGTPADRKPGGITWIPA